MSGIDELWEQVNDLTLDPLARARASQEIRVRLKTLSRVLVAAARDDGHTWREIGDALEITRQAAHQRFS